MCLLVEFEIWEECFLNIFDDCYCWFCLSLLCDWVGKVFYDSSCCLCHDKILLITVKILVTSLNANVHDANDKVETK